MHTSFEINPLKPVCFYNYGEDGYCIVKYGMQ